MVIDDHATVENDDSVCEVKREIDVLFHQQDCHVVIHPQAVVLKRADAAARCGGCGQLRSPPPGIVVISDEPTIRSW